MKSFYIRDQMKSRRMKSFRIRDEIKTGERGELVFNSKKGSIQFVKPARDESTSFAYYQKSEYFI